MSVRVSVRLRLQDLPELCSQLSRNHVASLADAASVMLDKFHRPPTTGSLDDRGDELTCEIDWEPPSIILRATHANELDATEDGAYALALSTVINRGFVPQRRAHHGSGSDYLITRAGEPDNDFIKLEVSGVARGSATIENRRLDSKLQQLARGDLSRPGIAVVVGFESTRILMRDQP